MQGSLGEKIGEGVFADVHAWAPGQVVKLSKPGIPQWVVQHETQMTRAVFAAGGPAPEVLGEVTLDGRFGIVLPRFDGPTLTQATRTRAITRYKRAQSLRRSALPFTRRDRRRTHSRCARRWMPDCGSAAACFRSASPAASSR
jgi:hypothetical protein